MKIALICPSNILYMPYVKNYEQILIEQNIDYDIINWDRFQMEEIRENTYRDQKKGHQRSFLDYLKYKQFLMERLNSSHYDKVIVFGIQLTYFLKELLVQRFNRKFVIDIRDYNKILKFFDIRNIIEASEFIVLSSPGFKKWLPYSEKYLINHNTQIKSINEFKRVNIFTKNNKINISNIGAMRDFKVNRKFIYSLKNHKEFQLNYHGEGEINDLIKVYLYKNNINNVVITGRYHQKDEAVYYEKSDLINVLRFNDGINNQTALPNRLYKAVLYGKPLLAFEGSYLADLVSTYKLGIVISKFNNIEQLIIDYLNEFDVDVYCKGRESFITKVMEENTSFKNNFVKVLTHQYIQSSN